MNLPFFKRKPQADPAATTRAAAAESKLKALLDSLETVPAAGVTLTAWRMDLARVEAARKVLRDPVFYEMLSVARGEAMALLAASENDNQVDRLKVFDNAAGFLRALRTLQDMAEPYEEPKELEATYAPDNLG